MAEPVEMKHLHFAKYPVECITYDMRNDIFVRFLWFIVCIITIWFPVAFVVFGAAYDDWSESFLLMFYGLISTLPVYGSLACYSWYFAWSRRRQAELIMQAKAEFLANGEY